MSTLLLNLLLAASVLVQAADTPQFDSQGQLTFPENYREWIYLSSGLGMTYGPAAALPAQNPMFDNVYVSPSAFARFKESGKWPEGTMFVLEIRYSTSQGSINKGGFFQTDVAAIEVEVKDSKRFPKGWAYFDFGGGLNTRKSAASALAANSSCQGCHEPNGAVENTFTQFYPTALAIAEKKGTVKPSYKPFAASPARLFQMLQEKKSGAVEILDATKAMDPKSAALNETNLNRIGYGLLQSGDKEQAIATLKWMTVAYPESANAADSLAEAYEANHQFDLARQANSRALTLLDTDQTTPAARKERVKKALLERATRLSGK